MKSENKGTKNITFTHDGITEELDKNYILIAVKEIDEKTEKVIIANNINGLREAMELLKAAVKNLEELEPKIVGKAMEALFENKEKE